MKDIEKRKGVNKLFITLPQEGACYVVVKEALYIPLVNALVARMTTQQLQNTVQECRGVKYIAFPDIKKCFHLVGIEEEIDHNVRNCICGVSIVHVYKIYNIDEPIATYNQHPIGCECIKHWSEDEHKRIKRQKKRKDHLEKDPFSTFCFMCNQKTNVRDCPCKHDFENIEVKRKAFGGWAGIYRKKGGMDRIPIGQLVKNKTYYWVLKEQRKNPRIKSWMYWVLNGGLDHDRHKVCEKLHNYKMFMEADKQTE